MQLKNTEQSYSIVSKLLHWLMAFAFIGMLALGLYMDGMPRSPEKFQLYAVHKSIGALLVFLAVLRIVWRVINKTPAKPAVMKKWQVALAEATHGFLYIAMLVMPVSGLLMSMYGGHEVSVFGWFTMPMIVEPNPDMGKIAHWMHGFSANLLIVLIAFHLFAALYHQFILKDGLLKRMALKS